MQTFARVSIDVLRYQCTAKLTIFQNKLSSAFSDRSYCDLSLKKSKKKAVDSKQSDKRKTFLCTNFLYSLELSMGCVTYCRVCTIVKRLCLEVDELFTVFSVFSDSQENMSKK